MNHYPFHESFQPSRQAAQFREPQPGAYMVRAGGEIEFFESPILAAAHVMQAFFNDLSPFAVQMQIANMNKGDKIEFFDGAATVELT